MTHQEKAHRLTAEAMERRSQPRATQPDAAEVLIQHPDGNVTFQAVLVNTSHGGMCIRHWHKELAIGQMAQISSPAFPRAAARVVWNWTVGPVVISGLQKLGSQPDSQGVLAGSAFPFLHASGPTDGGSSATTRTKLRSRLLGVMGGIVLIAGWHFRTALWRIWSSS